MSFKSLLARSLLSFSFIALLQPTAHAQTQGGPFGLGIVLGEPTAITGKYHMDQRQAIDFGLAFNLSRWFLLYGDWQYHFPGAFGRQNAFVQQLTPYVGVGGLLVISNKDERETRGWRYYSESSSSKIAVGVRIPLGIEWRAPTIPLGVFLELVPGIVVMPATDAFFQGGLGVRYFF